MQFRSKWLLCTISAFILILGQVTNVTGQDLTESSLKNFPKNVHDSLYYELFRVERTSDFAKAKQYCFEGLSIAQDYDHVEMQVKFYNALGWLNQQTGDYELSEQNYRKGVSLAEEAGLTERLMFLYNNLGVLFEAQSRFDDALQNYFKSLDYARPLKRYQEHIVTLNNVGLIYYRIGEYQQGIDYLTQGIKMSEEEKITTELASSYTIRGLCLNELKEYQEGNKNFLEAEKLCNDSKDCDNQTLTDIYYGLLYSQYHLGDYQASKRYFQIGFRYAQQTNNKVSMSLYYHFKAKLFVEEKKFDSALLALDTSDYYARALNSKLRILNNLELYSEIHELVGNVSEALKYKNLYILSKDSIFSNSLKENLTKIQMAEAQKEKQAIIDRQSEVIRQRNIIMTLALIAFGLTALSAFLLYKLYTANRRSKLQLEDVVSKRTAELKLANRKLRQANKDYEKFIYRTYHDLKGPLATIVGLVQIARKETSVEEVLEHLNKIKATSDKLTSILNILISVNELKSRVLNHEAVKLSEMIKAMHSHLEHINPEVKLIIDVKDEGADNIITDKLMCETLLREMVKNALFHTKKENGQEVNVTIHNTKTGTELEMSNNGIAIPEKIGNKVFDIFIVGSERHGAGLGLYLAQIASTRISAAIAIKQLANPVIFTVRFPHLVD